MVRRATTNLSNDDIINVIYTLNEGYIWDSQETDNVDIQYTVQNLPTGVKKPGLTTTAGSVQGIINYGVFTATPLQGTTITTVTEIGTKNKYKNGDKIIVIYTLDDNYAWADGSVGQANSIYEVSSLKNGIQMPNVGIVPLDFVGQQGKGTFAMPSYENTNITITTGGSGIIPSRVLSNGDTVTLSFVPTTGYAWTDNTTTGKSVKYTVFWTF